MFRKRDTDPIRSDEELTLDPLAEDIPAPLQASSGPSVSDVDLPENPPVPAPSPTPPPVATPRPPIKTQSAAEPHANKRLIVGEGIRLSGEINSCDRLVVEGEVEVTLNDTLALEITSSGRFTGGCEVEDADISGIYEGDLTVRNRLFVRGTGQINGTIRYGQLELERGGRIAGNVSVLTAEDAAGSDNLKARSSKTPLFGGGKSGA